MTQVYIFQAALLCTSCAESFMEAHAKPDFVDMSDESSYDSDDWPKGPYPDGGGEADTPQHCDRCRAFLDNPLTGDGETYVRDAFRKYVETARENFDMLVEWKDSYGWCFDDFAEITLPMMEEDKGGKLPIDQQARFNKLERGYS